MYLARRTLRAEQLLGHALEIALAAQERRAQVLALDLAADARERRPAGQLDLQPAPMAQGGGAQLGQTGRATYQLVHQVVGNGQQRWRALGAGRWCLPIQQPGQRVNKHIGCKQAQLAMVARPVMAQQPIQRVSADEHGEGIPSRQPRCRPANHYLVLVLGKVFGRGELGQVRAHQGP